MEDDKEYNEGDTIEEGPWAGFEIIDKYTRADAISDGVLIDVTTQAKEAGIMLPVTITRVLWDMWVEPDELSSGETVYTRLSDVLQMFKVGIRSLPDTTDILFFKVFLSKEGRKREVEFKAVCGPGDKGEPVITIMLPYED